MSSATNSSKPSLLVTRIKSFLQSYQIELSKKKKSTPSSNFSSARSQSKVPDPTTANALNTSTVVILRKKSSKLKNSPFDGVPLSNYRLRPEDVKPEVFDWVSHFLWLKNCPVELSTVVAIHIANRMSTETIKKFQGTDTGESILAPALASPEGGQSIPLDLPSMDTLDHTPRSSLPSALCSVDVARQSRELVDEYLEELGSNPDNAVEMVSEYLEGFGSPNGQSSSAPFTSSIHAMKNSRSSMEDRHIIIHDLNKALNLQLPNQYSYYAVFDGHAGVDAASYSTAHLHHNLVSTDAFKEGRIEEAFAKAFEITDSLYIKRFREDGVEKLQASGTTAICALIENNKTVYLAWVGDSQAVLVRNGCHEEIMLPHKPELDSERERIQNLGGMVVFIDTWRVNGVLSVSRAIGDPHNKPLISAEPGLAKFEIDSSLDFFVLGCDGLFDQLTGQDITSHVFEFLCRNENRDTQEVMYEVSEYLSEMAIREGSTDNITSIVIFFKPFEQLVATGLPVEPEEQISENKINEVETTPVTALPTTNGGHFPYTDFSELPIGSNFKISPEKSASQEVVLQETNSFLDENNSADDLCNLQQPDDKPSDDISPIERVDSNSIVEEGLITPINADPLSSQPEDNLDSVNKLIDHSASNDHLQNNQIDNSQLLDFLSTPVIEAPNCQVIPDSDCNTQTTLENFLEQTLTANSDNMEVEVSVNGHHNSEVDNSIMNPAQVSTLNGHQISINGMGENIDNLPEQSESCSKKVFADDDAESSSAQINENNPFEAITSCNEINAASESMLIADQTLTSTSSEKVFDQFSNVAPELSASLISSMPEVEASQDVPNEESVPDIIQHASDSGYCYTNSLSEFSTSFPSENKLEDNFCSTPVQQVENVDFSSELVENQSSIFGSSHDNASQVTIDNHAIEDVNLDNGFNNFENSLHNNSLLVEPVEESRDNIFSIEESKQPDHLVEESKLAEPLVEESKQPEPLVEESKPPEPFVEESKLAESLVEESKQPEPLVEESKQPEPFVEESKPAEPFVEESKPAEPLVEESKQPEPFAEESKPAEPLVEESKPAEPLVEESKPAEPLVEESKPAEPLVEESKPAELLVEESKPAETLVEESNNNTSEKFETNSSQNESGLPIETDMITSIPVVPSETISINTEEKSKIENNDNLQLTNVNLDSQSLVNNTDVISSALVEEQPNNAGHDAEIKQENETNTDISKDTSEIAQTPIVPQETEKQDDNEINSSLITAEPIVAKDVSKLSEPIQKKTKPSVAQPKSNAPSVSVAKKSLTSTNNAPKPRLGLNSKPSTLTKTSVTATKPKPIGTTSGATRTLATKPTPKPTPRPTAVSTSRVPATSRLATLSKPKPSASTTANSKPAVSTTAAAAAKPKVPAARKPLVSSTRISTTTTKPVASTATSRLTSTSRATTTVPSSRPATSTTSSSQLKTIPSKTLTDSKPSYTRRSLPSTMKPNTGATRPAPTKSTLPSTNGAIKPTTRTSMTSSVASKVGSFRTTTSTAKPAPAKPAPSKTVNGTAVSGIKAVKKPTSSVASNAHSQSTTVSSKSTVVLNGNSSSIKPSPSFTHKRNNLIGVENSLKQELEDAVMNELNGNGPVPTVGLSNNTEEASSTSQ